MNNGQDGRDGQVGLVRQVLWPLALLILFALAFRGTIRDGLAARVFFAAAEVSLRCDAPATDDLRVLEQCVTLEPNALDLRLDLGRAYESAGRWNDAERVYRQALDADARDGDIHLRLARALLQRGDAAAAQREGHAALAIQPGNLEAQALIERAAAKAGR